MGYIIKQTNDSKASCNEHCLEDDNMTHKEEIYKVFVIELTTSDTKVHDLNMERFKQMRIQFLYREREQHADKFLVLIHQECKQIIFTN